ncbi:MAG TPA: SUMF1/EgtB/PvdO family nonheme iron enzyme [Pyrinomonadaceae bacterium]|nr:SUMF1/EgtB/PvdO family nonheme iron enzyme [Pyrinomonadaceae bacterium]
MALVIGNSDYESSPLPNPVNDARLMADSLNEVGFQTVIRENLSLEEMKAAIQSFTGKLPKNGVGLFYYAGHGVQIDGRNFLIPVDFDASQSDVAGQAIEVDSVIGAITGKSGLNILILDACRNAPKGFSASSSNKKGLAEIKNAPAGTYIAFSTAPGKTAKDGTGENSPYSLSLAENLRLRPSRLEDVFIRTRIQVDDLTGGEQTPWENSSIRMVFHFTEDTFAQIPELPFNPSAVADIGRILKMPVTVPILNESGRRINTLKNAVTYFIENEINLEMMQIPGGKFLMGASAEQAAAAYQDAKSKKNIPEARPETVAAEMPRHQVNVPGFFMSKTEITQVQWQMVMGRDKMPNIPEKFRGADLPVVNVSWRKADEFCQKLSQLTGKNYRLPTEAEWEFAAKARNDAPFAFGETISSMLANFRGNMPFLAAARGEFRAALVPVGSLGNLNAFGLADMHGNVWEWTADNWHDDYTGAPTDGSSWEAEEPEDEEDEDPRLFRVIRGGSWDSIAGNCRSSHRRRQPQMIGSTKIGFRVVMQ